MNPIFSPSKRPVFHPGSIPLYLMALVFMLPVLTILAFSFQDTGARVWGHLAHSILGDAVSGSLILAVSVALCSSVIGISSAWLVALCHFPGRRWFAWALLLPMTCPAYILGFLYADFLHLRPLLLGLAFPIYSTTGAVMVMSLVLYPYIYALTLNSLETQSSSILECSRTLGHAPWSTFWRVVLPLTRPALAVSIALVAMETLADFGVAQLYGLETLTTAIFRVWLGQYNIQGGAQLAMTLLSFILMLVLLEQYMRRRMAFHNTSTRHRRPKRYRLEPPLAWSATVFCGLIFVLGFALPFGLLAHNVLALGEHGQIPHEIIASFVADGLRSVGLAASTAVLILLCATFAGYNTRRQPHRLPQILPRFMSLGYAVPGTVLALGLLIPLSRLDHIIHAMMADTFGITTGLWLSGSVAILILAYVIRFFAPAFASIESGLACIRPAIDEAAGLLGASRYRLIATVHLPMLKAGFVTAMLLVFVEVMKELPATLILRPFDFNTLAVRAYGYASNELIAAASLPAMAIMLLNVLPVLILFRIMRRG